MIDGAEELNGKHRRLLDREKELLAIHLQQFAIADCFGVAVAAMFRRDQRSGPEDVSGLDHFMADLIVPSEFDGSFENSNMQSPVSPDEKIDWPAGA